MVVAVNKMVKKNNCFGVGCDNITINRRRKTRLLTREPPQNNLFLTPATAKMLTERREGATINHLIIVKYR